MIKFREKKFSALSEVAENTLKWGIYGGAVASGSGIVANKLGKRITFSPLFKKQREKIWEDIQDTEDIKSGMFKDNQFNKDKFDRLNNKIDKLKLSDQTYLSLTGAIFGASLGMLYSLGKLAYNGFSKKAIVNQCLDQTVTYLKKMGYKEDQHFTKNRKYADTLKTKITIAIVKSSGDLIVLVNSKNDPKLNKINHEVIKNLPTETVSQKETDRFNEITITSTSSNNGDALFISSIAEKFIKAGFPVFLLEVSN